MGRLQLRWRLEYAVFLALVFIVDCLPVRASVQLARGMAWFVHRGLPRRMTRYNVARENLQAAFGVQMTDRCADRIILGMWRHLFRMIFEMIQLPRRFRLYSCADVLEFERRDDCVNALCSGRPVLLLGGHFGNWELSVSTFGHFGFPMGVVGRHLDNPYLHGWFRRFREASGSRLILKHGAGQELNEILETGGHATMLCDQDAGRGGVFVNFFGRPASTFKSIALLALHHNALVIVGGAFRLPEAEQTCVPWIRFRLVTQDIIDAADFQTSDGVTALTQRFTSSLEALIRRAPEQYFWVHRRWKTTPESQRRRRKAAAA